MAKTKKSVPKVPKTIPAPKQVKCRAAEVGHAACKCGGPHCGDNITS